MTFTPKRRTVENPEYTTLTMPYPHVPADVSPVTLTIQANIPAHELRRLHRSQADMDTLCEAFAPYIVGWSFVDRDAAGDQVPVDPPSVAGAGAFDTLSVEFVMNVFMAIYRISVARTWEEVNQKLQRHDWDSLTPSA